MEYDKLKAMLKGEKSMQELAIHICKNGSLRDMDLIQKVILFLHADDKALAYKAGMLSLKLKKSISNIERIMSHYKDYSPEGRWQAHYIQERFRNTKKLRSFFYTEEEVKKLKEQGLIPKYEDSPAIKIKHFKKQEHGKK